MATSPKEEPMSVGEEKGSTTNTTGKDISEDEYPPAKKLFFIMLAIYLTMFLVALVSLPMQLLCTYLRC